MGRIMTAQLVTIKESLLVLTDFLPRRSQEGSDTMKKR